MSSEKTGREGRRSPRTIARIPLEVRPIQDCCTAVTAVINLQGALILSRVPWPPATILEIRNQKNKRSIRARVVWSGPQDDSGSYKLGVEFEGAESGFWGDDYKLNEHTKP